MFHAGEGGIVAIYRIFEGGGFDRAQVERMGQAYEAVLVVLGLTNRSDDVTNTIAEYIIEVARAGETEPTRICEIVLQRIQNQ
jgi:hypothetical protein